MVAYVCSGVENNIYLYVLESSSLIIVRFGSYTETEDPLPRIFLIVAK